MVSSRCQGIKCPGSRPFKRRWKRKVRFWVGCRLTGSYAETALPLRSLIYAADLLILRPITAFSWPGISLTNEPILLPLAPHSVGDRLISFQAIAR